MPCCDGARVVINMASTTCLKVFSCFYFGFLINPLFGQLAIPYPQPTTCATAKGNTPDEYFDIISMKCQQCPVNTERDSTGNLLNYLNFNEIILVFMSRLQAIKLWDYDSISIHFSFVSNSRFNTERAVFGICFAQYMSMSQYVCYFKDSTVSVNQALKLTRTLVEIKWNVLNVRLEK